MNEHFEKISNGTEDLANLAQDLVRFAKDNKIWAFYGEMGSGKTTFIRNICQILGVKENVSSPTFSLINEYNGNLGKFVYHFDFYRIQKEQEAIDIGCEEYFESGSLCLIEWPEKIINLLPHPLVKVAIIVTDKNRKFIFSYE